MGKRFVKGIEYIKRCILNTIYDEEEGLCLNCGRPISYDFLCESCKKEILIPKEPYILEKDYYELYIYSGAYYSAAIKNMILAFKYKDNFQCGEFLGQLMIKCMERFNLDEVDMITYVPMTKENKKKRGFNQSEFLSSILGEKFDLEIDELLEKKKGHQKQKTLSVDERWENAKNGYNFIEGKDVKDKNIILVDDVLTTGATVFYCSRELMKNGARKVWVLTAAKSRI
ncbi:MAG: ComF family protein [Clostridium sp.]|uniref:ComF family protein n=1 Tax=Clostridium sp. TaxID=1506 RepID=UPI002A8602A1|nr:ComF family protein [Clostridium sp.]MDY5098556.1 ComF family protein [Clostridium sp.]